MLKFITKAQVRANEIRENEEGATMVEYGLLVALIAVVVAVGAALLGTEINTLFTGVVTAIPGGHA